MLEALAKAGDATTAGQNYTKVKDPQVDALLNATDQETDPAKRAAQFNQADQQLATNDVTVIPLFQKPTQLGYRDTDQRRAGQPDPGRLHLEHRGLDLHAADASGDRGLPRSAPGPLG